MVGSVVGCDLVDPCAELANTSIHGRCTHIAVGGAPGDNANKYPHIPLLADKRASGITLREGEGEVSLGGWGAGGQCRGQDRVVLT